MSRWIVQLDKLFNVSQVPKGQLLRALGGGVWYWIGSVVIGFGDLAWALSSGMKGAPYPACGNKHWQIAEGVIEACHQCEA
ncbi:MAG: hypothetical protein ACI87O_002592, partial [Planctomycetota bacterium]